MIKKRNSLGFTLIEMLVSIAIIITTTTVVVAILASSFTGITKSAVSEDVRQNGNGALSRISRTIQFAESFQGISSDDLSYEADCTSGGGGETYRYVRVRTNSQIVKMSCTDSDIMLGGASLIDKSRVSVIEDSCSFTCIQESEIVPPVIGISFGLFKAGTDNQNTENFFTTSVKMRNL